MTLEQPFLGRTDNEIKIMESKKKDTEKRGRLKHEHYACNDLYLFIYFRTQAD